MNAHTITTLKNSSNAHVAGAARNIEILISHQMPRCDYVRSALAEWAAHTGTGSEWAAIRGYASRALCAMTTPKCGMIVVNGAACFVPQNGARLSVDMAEIGATRMVGIGGFQC